MDVKESDAIVSENPCMSDGELMGDIGRVKILDHYKFKNQIIQNTASVKFANRYDAANVGKKSREDCLIYMRKANRLLRNDIGGRKWDNAETYDHTRAPTKGKSNFGMAKMPTKEHFRDSIIIGRGVNNCAFVCGGAR